GPWSAPVLLYRCPEMGKDKGVFSYAAKAHPWAAAGNELVVSYCVNTWEFARLFRDDKVYRRKFVRVELGPANRRSRIGATRATRSGPESEWRAARLQGPLEQFHEGVEGLVDRGGHAEFGPPAGHVAVQRVDLGALATGDVLRGRG